MTRLRVAVLGGTRFIGPPILRALREGGHELLVYHRGDHEARDVPGWHVHGDRRDVARLRAALRDFSAQVLVDTCAYTKTDAETLAAALPEETRTVVLSSMDVYRAFGSLRAGKSTDPVPLDETSALRAERYPFRSGRR